MKKKNIVIAGIGVILLGIGLLFFNKMFQSEFVPSDDEIALHMRLDTKEDIGLLVFDYQMDGKDYSGGISNADRSLIEHDSDKIQVWNKQELNSSSDIVDMSMQLRIITEYVDPNFENIYPENITKYVEPISWKAEFGKSYYLTITGDKENGYTAVLEDVRK